jgi:uncharacterized membrane protein YoaK (UPF0700 family)
VAQIDTMERASVGLRAADAPDASAVRDLMLVGLTFASGAVDSIAFLGLSKVFSSFMTGNLVFLGLGVAGSREPDIPRVLPALGAFALGVFLAVRIVTPTRGTGIWPPRVSFALAAGALAQAAFLAGWLVTSGRPSGGEGHVLIALSALAFGMQSAAVMSLDVKGVFTTAATATVIMLMSDEAGWSRSTAERRRLASVVAGLVAGAAAGAYLLLHARPYAPILPLVVTVAVISAAPVFVRR